MDIKKGSIVRAKAGRDKGSFFIVVSVDCNFAFIADGKRRRLEKPKMKRERLSNDELKKTIRKEFNLETKTISFLSLYIYGDFLFEKLYNAITESDN